VFTLDLAPVLDVDGNAVEFAGNFWDNNIKYPAVKLVNGVDYKLTFEVKTDVVGNTADSFIVKVEDGVYGTEGFWQAEQYVKAGDDWTTVELIFNYTNPNTIDATLMFMIGGIEQVLEVRNLELYISTAGANANNVPVITGNQDMVLSPGDVVDLAAGVTATDVEDGELTPTFTVLGPNDETVFDSSIEGTWVVTYSVTDADGNTVTATSNVNILSMVYNPTDLIPNGSFDSSGWYTWVDVWNYNGSGAAEAYLRIANGDTDPEMEINIVSGGGAGWTVQMTQDVTLEAGVDYIVTFDAYAAAARSINAVLGYSDASNAWVEFGGLPALPITDTKTTYTYTFTALDPGDFQVQLKFEAGGDDNNVFIDNVKVEKYDGTDPIADTDVAYNGDFSMGDNLEGWSIWSRNYEGISITSSVMEAWGELVFVYDGVGDASWNNQISFEGIEFEVGATYRLVFKAKGDAAREFKVNIYDGFAGLESEVFNLTTDFMEYEHVFTYTLGATAKVEFQLGAFTTSDGTMFYLDDVVIEKLEQDEVLMNGEFDETGWTAFVDYWWWSGAASEVYFNAVDGEMEVDIVQPGGETWAIQLIQNIELEAGQQYIVTFDAYADEARNINAVTGYQRASDNTWQQFGGTSDLALTTTKTTYTYILTATDPGDDQVQLKFEGGGNAVNFYVDNVKLEKYDGTDPVADTDVVVNGTFDQALEWGEWIDPEGWSGAATEAYITVVNGEAMIDVVQAGGALWAVQLSQNIELEAGMTYIVMFDAKAEAARNINAVVGFDNGAWNLMGGLENQAITDEYVTYSFSFVATDSGDAQVVIKFEAGADLNNVHIDNVIIYPDYN
jgi:hypothetical protein